MLLRLDSDAVVSVSNLEALKTFILKSRVARTFCQMYNQNPFLDLERVELYLMPDPGGPHAHPQWNINCDPKRGDFRRLVIRRKLTSSTTDSEFQDQYRELDFQSAVYVEMKCELLNPWDLPRAALVEALAIMNASREI